MRSKVVFVNRFYYPDHSATSQMLTDLATALAARGRPVQIITSRLRYDASSCRLERRETDRGVEIVRVPTSGFGRRDLFGRSLDYITFFISAAWALLWLLRRGDIVVAKTDPPMMAVVVAPIAWLRGARLVNWLQDVFPEVARALNVGFAHGPVSRLSYGVLKFLRDATLRSAHQNVVLGERMAEHVKACGVHPRNIRIIPNWADGEQIRPIKSQQNSLRRRWGLQDCFVVGYSGNLGRAHDITALLHAIEGLELCNEAAAPRHAVGSDISPGWSNRASAGQYGLGMPEIRWLFIGSGAQMERLRDEVRERGLTTVLFQPYQPREQLAESLSAADVHLISLRPSLEGLIVPSKFYSIAAAGRPAIFIGDHNGEIAGILHDSDTGVVIAEGDGDALVSAVLDYAQDRTKTRVQGERARQLFEQRYSFGFTIKAWEQLLDDASA